MALMHPPDRSAYFRLPAKFAYLANSLATSLSVLAQREVIGVWPAQAQESTVMDLASLHPRSSVKLTLTNVWPFTVSPTEQMVAGYLAATAYNAFNDWETGYLEKDVETRALEEFRKLDQVQFLRKTGSRNKITYLGQLAMSAEMLHDAYRVNRLAADLPRIAAYFNIMLGLTVSASKNTLSAISLYMRCCGGDAWLKTEIFNTLFDRLVEEIPPRQKKLGIEVTEEEVAQHLTNLDVTISTFVGLEDPWGLEGPQDVEIARQLILDLAKYMEALGVDSPAVNGVGTESPNKSKQVGQPLGGGAPQPDERLPELMEELLSHSDIAEAIEQLVDSTSGEEHTGVGTQAGTSSNVIRINNLRPPTPAEHATARELATVLTQFTAMAKPGEVRNVDDGRIDVLRWFQLKHQAPGDLTFRRHDTKDRRPDFSMALAVVVDSSGSMAGKDILEVCSASWTLVEAFRQAHRAGAPSKVWSASFNTVWEPVHFGEMVPEIAADGGTRPYDAVKAALVWLDKQTVAHRFLVVYTDDEWPTMPDDMLNAKHPVTNLMFTTANGGSSREKWQVYNITGPHDMVAGFRQIMRNTLGRVASGHRMR